MTAPSSPTWPAQDDRRSDDRDLRGLLAQDGGTPARPMRPTWASSRRCSTAVFKSGGYPLVEGYSRDDYRKSYAKMVELVGGCTRPACRSSPEPTAWASSWSASLNLQGGGLDHRRGAAERDHRSRRACRRSTSRTGSIAVGKEADMVLVDGDVSKEPGRASPGRDGRQRRLRHGRRRAAEGRGYAAGLNSPCREAK